MLRRGLMLMLLPLAGLACSEAVDALVAPSTIDGGVGQGSSDAGEPADAALADARPSPDAADAPDAAVAPDVAVAPDSGVALLPSYTPCGTVGFGLIERAVPSPDGTLIAVATRARDLVLVDANRGHIVRRIAAHVGRVDDVVFAANGRTLVSWGSDGDLRAWRLDDGSALWSVRPAFRSGRPRLAAHDNVVALGGPPVELFDIASGARVLSFDHPASNRRSTYDPGLVAFSPDGQTIVAARGETAYAFDRDGTPQARQYSGDLGTVSSVAYQPDIQTLAFTPDGAALLVAVRRAYFTTSGGVRYPVARLYRVADGEPIATLSGWSSYGVSAALSPDGTHVAVSAGAAVGWWQVRDPDGTWLGDESVEEPTDVTPGELLVDARERIVSRRANERIDVRRPYDGSPALEILAGASDGVLLAFGEDILWRSAGDGSRIELWSVDPVAPQRLTTLADAARVVDMSADGRWIALAQPGGVYARPLNGGLNPTRVSTVAYAGAIAFAPDGASIAIADRPQRGASTLTVVALDGTVLARTAARGLVEQLRRGADGASWLSVGPSRDHYIGPTGVELWPTHGDLRPRVSRDVEGPGLDAADVSTDGSLLVGAGWITPLFAVDVPRDADVPAGEARVARVAFSPDGRALLLGAGRGAVSIAPPDRPSEARPLWPPCAAANCPAPEGDIARIVFAADARTVAVSTALGDTRLYCKVPE